MKKKILSFVLSLSLLLPCALTLTACGGDGHTHEYETTWSKDSTSHWYDCKGDGCDEKKDKGNHTYNVDTCSVCGYVNSDLTPATLQSMDTYFSGVKAEYLKSNFTGTNGVETFEELLDTQIDVLAQDILYRLTKVYVKTQNIQDFHNLLNGSGVYKFGNNNAIIDKNNILAQLPAEFNYDSETLISVDLTGNNGALGYQKAIVINNDANILKSQNYLDFRGAIDGYNTKFSADIITGNKSFDKNTSNQWNVVNQISKPSGEDVAFAHMMQYEDSLKVKIAQILSGDTNTNYNVLLEKVNVLGYNNLHKNQIVSLIKNDIIGQALVNKDDEYFEIIKNDYNSLINGSFILAVRNNNNYTNDYSPLFYKGYSIVVPAIVEQALNNTFEGTNISLYPKMSRTAYESTTTTTGFTTEKAYQTITLMPKADAVTTKLVVKLTGVGASIGQTIAVDYDVVINGTTYSGTKNVTLTSTEQEVEIELSTITNGTKLGTYNGTTTSHISGNAFDNNDFDAQGNIANNDGNNYIKLDFNNTNNYSFIVTYGGMYNK